MSPFSGSSPLARGLHVHCGFLWFVCGIIPARAGFTGVRDARHRPPADHPRSRGVYTVDGTLARNISGSSPLARGLRDRHGQFFQRVRIIPARAGFTTVDGTLARNISDHPRSRGVYRRRPPDDHEPQGSSPLARGLPSGSSRISRPGGIIPARAGFTDIWAGSSSPCRDHPRSRGVYAADTAVKLVASGSSPLARGLRR